MPLFYCFLLISRLNDLVFAHPFIFVVYRIMFIEQVKIPCCAVAKCTNHSDCARELKLSFHTFPDYKLYTTFLNAFTFLKGKT